MSYFSTEGYVPFEDLKRMSFDELYSRKIVIFELRLSRNGGILLSKWLLSNSHLVLSSSRESSKTRWGRESEHFSETAFF